MSQITQARYRAGDLDNSAFNSLTEAVGDAQQQRATQAMGGQTFVNAVSVAHKQAPEATRLRLADTLDRWREWVDTHPDAMNGEARKEYRVLTISIASLPENDAVALPTPRALGSDRGAIEDMAKLVQAAKDTQAADDSHQMDKATYDNEGRILAGHISALKFRQRAAEQAAAEAAKVLH